MILSKRLNDSVIPPRIDACWSRPSDFQTNFRLLPCTGNFLENMASKLLKRNIATYTLSQIMSKRCKNNGSYSNVLLVVDEIILTIANNEHKCTINNQLS